MPPLRNGRTGQRKSDDRGLCSDSDNGRNEASFVRCSAAKGSAPSGNSRSLAPRELDPLRSEKRGKDRSRIRLTADQSTFAELMKAALMTDAMQLQDGFLMVAGPCQRTSPIVGLDATTEDALCQLERCGRRELLVADHAGSLVGVISEAELAHSEHHDVGLRKTRSVESVLTARLRTESTARSSEINNMLQPGDELSCMPVLQDGRLVSLLTDDDFFVSWKQVSGLISAASKDQLTELASRATFLRRLNEEWERARRRQSPLALLLVDLDFFKLVNDRCGHLTGDSVLSKVGACLRRQLRSYDIVARLGGDEFAALCCDCQPEDVIVPIARLRNAVRELPVPPQLERNALSLSVGAAVVCSGFESLTIDDLYEAADEALYAAKRAGRDGAFLTVLNQDGGEISREMTELELESAGGVVC